jgi:glycosyltransferase involved in cell wall biosynthesis
MTINVSAIIIVHNGERFIREAIDSILQQDGPALELVVVDDGSTDGTARIVREFGPAVRMVTHAGGANLGMSASRNRGIAEARGRYIAFLDADDVWLPSKIAEQVAILDAEPATAMVYGRTLIWRSWDGSAEDYRYGLGIPPNETYPPGRLFRQLLANRCQTPTTCNAMIRRDVLLAVGGADPNLRGMFEDQLLFAKILATYPVHVSARVWAKYRQHDQSASAANRDPLTIDGHHLQYLDSLATHLSARGGVSLRDRMALKRTRLQVEVRTVARRARRRLKASL